VRVPAVFAVHLEPSDADDYAWVVEEYVRGALFFPERMSRRARCLASADIGRQLRRLHSFAASGFGRLSADLTQARHPGWRDWVDEQEAGVDEAVRLAGLAPDGAARIRSAYRFLRAAYMDTPRLCHGDFADDNRARLRSRARHRVLVHVAP
jgi:aminoglycoside phosphotransferase (APT) family kinase protein